MAGNASTPPMQLCIRIPKPSLMVMHARAGRPMADPLSAHPMDSTLNPLIKSPVEPVPDGGD